jgi:glutathione S-transferase
MMKLYQYVPSGNCYKVRLMLSLLGLTYQTIPIDFHPGREHTRHAFLRINPLGQLPVLDDGPYRLRDSHAILVYLASKYDPSGAWYPSEPEIRGNVAMWLAFAESLTSTISAARLHDTFMYDCDIVACRNGAKRLLAVLDEHLWFAERDGADWLATYSAPTISDIACFPYVMLSEQGGISREDFPAVRRWSDRVRRIPGWLEMPGICALTPIASTS